MSRPLRTTIQNGQQAWDADANNNFINLFDQPFPIHEHVGDESDLQSTFAAAAYDRCLVWVDHTIRGWTLYWSNGTSWVPFTGSLNVRTSSSATINLDAADDLMIVTGAGGNTVNLPTAASAAGKVINVKNNTTGTITIDGNAAETIDGGLTLSLVVQYESVSLVSDGSNWHVI